MSIGNGLLRKYVLPSNSFRNNSQPLAIFRPISAIGRPKSTSVGQISCTLSMGQQSVTYKISYLQKMADQFLILIFSTVVRSKAY